MWVNAEFDVLKTFIMAVFDCFFLLFHNYLLRLYCNSEDFNYIWQSYCVIITNQTDPITKQLKRSWRIIYITDHENSVIDKIFINRTY